MYPRYGPAGGGLLRLHSTYRHDLKIYSSDEGRVQSSAAAFTQGLLDLEGDSLTPILVRQAHSHKMPAQGPVTGRVLAASFNGHGFGSRWICVCPMASGYGLPHTHTHTQVHATCSVAALSNARACCAAW